MKVNFVKGIETLVVDINGGQLVAVDVTFITRADPDSDHMDRQPAIRMSPEAAKETIRMLSAALDRMQTRDFSGPGTAH